MSRGQQTFKHSDLTKALNAMVKAGIVGRVEIEMGRGSPMRHPPKYVQGSLTEEDAKRG